MNKRLWTYLEIMSHVGPYIMSDEKGLGEAL
jgi:hypothetical protein